MRPGIIVPHFMPACIVFQTLLQLSATAANRRGQSTTRNNAANNRKISRINIRIRTPCATSGNGDRRIAYWICRYRRTFLATCRTISPTDNIDGSRGIRRARSTARGAPSIHQHHLTGCAIIHLQCGSCYVCRDRGSAAYRTGSYKQITSGWNRTHERRTKKRLPCIAGNRWTSIIQPPV